MTIFKEQLSEWRLSRLVFVVMICFILLAPTGAKAEIPDRVSIDLHKVLGSEHVCLRGSRSVQFISEDELLVQAGPTDKCYQSVNQLELVVLSLDGHVLARKPWPSTFPTVILPSKRIAISNPTELQVLDDRLATIQTLSFPDQSKPSSYFLSSDGPDKVRASGPNGSFVFGGTPLLYLRFDPSESYKAGDPQLIYSGVDGKQLVRETNQLSERRNGVTLRKIASLDWVIPCDKFCQAYDAGTAFEVATTKEHRILVISNGSRFPVTDAAGLFPYFLEVFDLDTGAEMYREEYVTKTGQRSAALSPDGDLLAIFSDEKILVRKLKRQ